MSDTQDLKESVLREWIEESVDKGATSVEEIHRAIADLPIGVLERLGLFEASARDVRRIQGTSIGAIYDVIRKVNHEVSRLAGELLDSERRPGPARSAAASGESTPPPRC
ncbi:MAG: hypothetical protein ACQGVK_19845 [Myxococcota bacterium]